MEALSETQRESVGTFMAVSSIEDEGLAIEIMSASDWNLQSAVNVFMGGEAAADPTPQSMPAPSSSSSSSSSNSSSSSRGGIRSRGAAQASADPAEPMLASSPRAVSQDAPDNNENYNNNNNNNNNNAGSSGMDAPLVSLPGFITNFFKPEPLRINRDREARKFATVFRNKYGIDHPTFFDGSYSRAVASAFRSSKFLLVYLHSALHDDADRFVTDVLQDDDLRRYVNDNMILWAGQVSDAEAYELSSDFAVSSFPCLALVVCQSERSVIRADLIEGVFDAPQVLERVQTVAAAFQGELTRQREESARRSEDSMLREQQNSEYEQAEQNERLRREQQRRQAEEDASKAEQEKQERLRIEAEEAEKQRSLTKRIDGIRASLPVEPAPGPEVAQVRLQLPNGKKLNRCFRNTDKVQIVADYLTVQLVDNEMGISNFAMSTTYPKKMLEDYEETMEEAGLCPRAVLMVQDLDA